jgi:hypothetical protein
MRTMLTAVVVLACLAHTWTAEADNITPYYLFDGDSNVGYKIVNGTATSFETFLLAYPVAIRDSVWLGDRDDNGAREFTLNGSPTGRTSAGGNHFSQLLDGTAGRSNNYGVECCDAQNSVTVANSDWSGQRLLFKIPFDGSGIAYDWLTNTLYVSQEVTPTVRHYTLDGRLLDTFTLNQELVGLAYEQATDTFWGFNRSTHNLVEFNRAGAVLQDMDIPGFAPNNPWGGEMPVGASAVPEPASMMLLGTGVILIGTARPRLLRQRAAASATSPPVSNSPSSVNGSRCKSPAGDRSRRLLLRVLPVGLPGGRLRILRPGAPHQGFRSSHYTGCVPAPHVQALALVVNGNP